MDKLQKEFKDELLILCENGTDPKERTAHILKRLKKVMDVDLASDAETDWQTLGKIFQHAGHKPWIYKGKLIAITGKDEVNRENIRAVLNGKPLKMAYTNYDSLDSFPNLQLTENVIYRQENPDYKSAFSEELKGMKRDKGRKYPGRNGEGFYGIRFINYSLPDIINRNFEPIYGVESKNKELADKKFCYEIIQFDNEGLDRKGVLKLANERMKKDLGEALNLTVKRVKRSCKTYVLRTLGDDVSEKLKSKGEKKMHDVTAFYFTYKNLPFKNLVQRLHYCLPNEVKFFVSEVKYEGNVDIDIEVPTTDVKQMREALKKYGLDLSIEFRDHEILILTDK